MVSIGSNIAEGSGRSSNKSFKHFLDIAYGSACELETQLIILKNLLYLGAADMAKCSNEIEELQKMIFTFSKNLKT